MTPSGLAVIGIATVNALESNQATMAWAAAGAVFAWLLLAFRSLRRVIERIVAGARRHLNPGGILVVETGLSAERVRRRFRTLPFVWLEFAQGFAEVFVLRASELP